jgi:hypothetical protein
MVDWMIGEERKMGEDGRWVNRGSGKMEDGRWKMGGKGKVEEER